MNKWAYFPKLLLSVLSVIYIYMGYKWVIITISFFCMSICKCMGKICVRLFVSVWLVWVCVCAISISVSATDGPNTPVSYSLLSRPRLIARQEQQQEAVCVLLCFHKCVCVCVCFRACTLAGTFIYKPSCWKDSPRFGTHAQFWWHLTPQATLSVSLFALCVLIHSAVCLCACLYSFPSF